MDYMHRIQSRYFRQPTCATSTRVPFKVGIIAAFSLIVLVSWVVSEYNSENHPINVTSIMTLFRCWI
ncbi:hypothetical protein JCM33374_g6210 [Metschnikowia sp. JCM 33374]|nr:hypothetical protein JCM33374_g6210 [Metschnikowia sp. JCM 33374]